MKQRLLILLAVITGATVVLLWPRTGPRAQGPLPHEAYVWQRAWNGPVSAAVAEHGSNFSSLVALHAEVSWKDGQPQTLRVALPWEELRRVPGAVGLALRIGPFAGPFAPDDARARFLATLAQSLLAEARSNACPVSELQLDFDCATSKLDGYRHWVEAVRRGMTRDQGPMTKEIPSANPQDASARGAIGHRSLDLGPSGTRLTLTTLPSWLGSPAFAPLVRAADGFVLQVHSLDPPAGPDFPFTLCDPAAARRAVERAARTGVPFRVALPTYGYLVAFDSRGKFIGLSAEGPRRSWPAGATLREVIADPGAMAGLVREWTADRPEKMAGVVWYRLPVSGDTRNWQWPTLAAVLAGKTPRARLKVEARKENAPLVEIVLHNAGDADYTGRVRVSVRTEHSKVIASDAVNGFELSSPSSTEHQFDRAAFRFPPSGRRVIGWLRLERDDEVQLELKSD